MPPVDTSLTSSLPVRSNPLPPMMLRGADKHAAGQCPCGERRPLSVLLGMRSSQRPQLEGRWHCRRACLQHTVKAMVTREFRTGAAGESRMRHRVPLGLILQTRGVITQQQLRDALIIQEQTGARLGDVLIRRFGVPESRIASALASQWNAPVWHLEESPEPRLLRIAPLAILRSSGMIPVRMIGRRIHLASANSIDSALAFALERMHRTEVECGIASASTIDSAWNTLTLQAAPPAEEIRCTDVEELTRRMARTVEQLQPVESRAVRVGRRMWLRAWLEPAAATGGPLHTTDVVDYLFTLPGDRPVWPLPAEARA